MANETTICALPETRDRCFGFLCTHEGTEAEDVLQAAYVEALQKGDSIRQGGSAVAWFGTCCGSAVADVHREFGLQQRSMELTLRWAVTKATRTLSGTKLRQVERAGASVPEVARDASITPNSAGIRLHRARRALRRGPPAGLRRLCAARLSRLPVPEAGGVRVSRAAR